MPKFLIHANYVGDGINGLVKEGGTARRAAAEKAVVSRGGTLEAFYYAFGETDAYVIVDLPDNTAMASVALAINATGVVTAKTTALLTPEDMDRAAKAAAAANYRAPGH